MVTSKIKLSWTFDRYSDRHYTRHAFRCLHPVAFLSGMIHRFFRHISIDLPTGKELCNSRDGVSSREYNKVWKVSALAFRVNMPFTIESNIPMYWQRSPLRRRLDRLAFTIASPFDCVTSSYASMTSLLTRTDARYVRGATICTRVNRCCRW